MDSHLLEALIHLLIEKGVLTRNDALSIIETVTLVKGGADDPTEAAAEQKAADLTLLERLFVSFDALDDGPGIVNYDGENVRRLRPPIHGDRPKFPREE